MDGQVNDPQQQQNGTSLIRFAGPPTAVGPDGKPAPVYDEDEDPDSDRKLDVEKTVHKDGLEVYKDQAGRLWMGLATYWIKRGEFDRAKETFETGIATVLTIRDFTQIFDAYAKFSKSVISGIMEELANPDEEGSSAHTSCTAWAILGLKRNWGRRWTQGSS